MKDKLIRVANKARKKRKAVQEQDGKRSGRRKRVLIVVIALGGCFVFIGLLLAGLLFSLPAIVSSDYVNRLANEQVAKAFNRPVTIKRLQWRWQDGILIQGIRIPDDPQFKGKPLFSLESLRLDIAFSKLLSRQVDLDLALTGLQVKLIRNAEGLSNLDKLLSSLPKGQPATTDKPPPEPPKSQENLPLTAIAFKLPVNIRAVVALEQIHFVMEDQKKNKRFEIKEAGVRLDMPSLFEQPTTLHIASDFFIDDRPLPRAQIDLSAAHVFTTTGDLNLVSAILNLKGRLPGVRIDISGDLTQDKVASQLDLNLPEIVTLAGPFLPETIQTADISGEIALHLDAQGDPRKQMQIHGLLNVSQLGLAGGPIKDKRIQPIDLKLTNDLHVDMAGGNIEAISGRLDLLSGSHLSWSGAIKAIKTKAPQADILLGPVELDISELMTRVEDFIPGSINLPHDPKAKKTSLHIEAVNYAGALPPDECHISAQKVRLSVPELQVKQDKQQIVTQQVEIDLEDLAYVGQLKKGPAQATCNALNIKLSDFKRHADKQAVALQAVDFQLKRLAVDLLDLKPVQNDLQAGLAIGRLQLINQKPDSPQIDIGGVDLQIDRCQVPMKDLFPTQADLKIGFSMQKLNLSGKQPVLCENLDLTALAVLISDINKQKNTLAGITAALGLKNQLSIGRFEIPPVLKVADLHQQLRLRGRLAKKPKAAFVIESLTINTPELATVVNQAAMAFGVDLDLKVAGIDVNGTSPLSVDIQKAQLTTHVEDAVGLDVEASLKELGTTGLDTRGHVNLNLTALSTKFLPLVLPKEKIAELKLSGTSDLDWQYTGRLPTPAEKKALAHPTFRLKADLPFLKQFDLNYSLDLAGLEMTRPDRQQLAIAAISTPKPLHYDLRPDSDTGKLTLDVVLKGISRLPGQTLDPPLNAELHLTGNHQGVQSIRIDQTLATTPIKVDQELTLVLEGLDRLLKKADFKPAAILSLLSGQVKTHLDVYGNEALDKTLKNVKLNGKVSAGAELKLIPGNSIGAKTWLLSPGMNVRLPDVFSVSKLRSNLLIEKSFQLQGGIHQTGGNTPEATPPLSTAVMQPQTMTLNNSEDALPADRLVSVQAGRRYIGELKERFNSMPSLAFQSALIGKSSHGFQIAPTKLEFKMDQGLPDIRYFQSDLLGGTISGACSIFEEGGSFYLRAQLAFSGIDTAKLLPQATVSENTHESEVSGQMLLIMPLVTKMKLLMEAFWLDIQFTHIGSRTIERLLLALDPTESNEAIVAQRKLFQSGSPRWIKIGVKENEFSLDGQVDIKGIGFKPVQINPINIASLDIFNKFEGHLLKLLPLIEGLRLSSAKALIIDTSTRQITYK